jgi:acylphosphatase
MISNKLSIHCFVTGRVQGVWFRSSAQKQAISLGVTGWARNLPDGRVEVLASGEKPKVMQFYTWLQKGPTLAKVNSVSYEEIPFEEHDFFSIK